MTLLICSFHNTISFGSSKESVGRLISLEIVSEKLFILFYNIICNWQIASSKNSIKKKSLSINQVCVQRKQTENSFSGKRKKKHIDLQLHKTKWSTNARDSLWNVSLYDREILCLDFFYSVFYRLISIHRFFSTFVNLFLMHFSTNKKKLNQNEWSTNIKTIRNDNLTQTKRYRKSDAIVVLTSNGTVQTSRSTETEERKTNKNVEFLCCFSLLACGIEYEHTHSNRDTAKPNADRKKESEIQCIQMCLCIAECVTRQMNVYTRERRPYAHELRVRTQIFFSVFFFFFHISNSRCNSCLPLNLKCSTKWMREFIAHTNVYVRVNGEGNRVRESEWFEFVVRFEWKML